MILKFAPLREINEYKTVNLGKRTEREDEDEAALTSKRSKQVRLMIKQRVFRK